MSTVAPSSRSGGLHGAIQLALLLVAVALLATCRPASRERVPTVAAPSAFPVAPLTFHASARPGRTLLALHGNEHDAATAARAFVDAHGGRLVAVDSGGARRLTLSHEARAATFDPNRVFTDPGRLQTLAERGAPADAAAMAIARSFSDQVLGAIGFGASEVVITVHNNTDGAYSAESYLPGGPLAHEAAALHLPAGRDPDHFYLVTTRALFNALVPAGYPVVLQDHARTADDGSLSVLSARRGVAYVNVEAQHGHADVQRAMLEALHRALPPAAADTAVATPVATRR